METVQEIVILRILSAVGDTANIWKDATSMVFSPDEGFNSRSFKN